MKLYYVPYDEIQKHKDDLETLATIHRINALYMIQRAGAGHIGSAFSSCEIMTYLYYKELKEDDIFFSSKGHDVAMQYAIMQGKGIIPFDTIHTFRQPGGLPGHPDINVTPEMVTNTGSLGMGISKARGMAIANRLNGKKGRIFVLCGDGEMEEGQNWEALRNCDDKNVIPIVDCNEISSDGPLTMETPCIVSAVEKLKWHIISPGNNDFGAHFDDMDTWDNPSIMFLDTTKGKGVSFMESKGRTDIEKGIPYLNTDLYKYHSGTLTEEEYKTALAELMSSEYFFDGVTVDSPPPNPSLPTNSLIPLYETCLYNAGENKDIVVLDADLVVDTGCYPFSQEYPDRFIECGISEQDMVSTAGGLALMGKIPIVHSFACFLTSRANEQIYNNCTEGKKVIYVGTMAGVIPFGPGESHESHRDIDLMKGMPNLTILEPDFDGVAEALNWAIYQNEKSTYIRLRHWPIIEGMVRR